MFWTFKLSFGYIMLSFFALATVWANFYKIWVNFFPILLVTLVDTNGGQNKLERFSSSLKLWSCSAGSPYCSVQYCLQFWKLDTIVHLMKCLQFDEKAIRWKAASMKSHSTNCITVLLTSCLTGLESVVWQLTIFVFLEKRLIQISQTGGQWYSDTSPFSIPCLQ
jgi:hypothetical protein